jgi:predicted GH43/DUF377 family glycosyl hydrolase
MKPQHLTWLLLLLLATSCRQEHSPSPLKFKGYEGNPVIVPGAPGSWDDLYVIMAFVLEYDDTIYLYYTAYNTTGSRALGLATSTDGFHFIKYEGNPILEGDGEGYDAFGVAQAQVLKADTGWVMYFNGRQIAGFSSGQAIGMATAPNLRGPWKKSIEPVLTTGKRGNWDSDFIYLGPVRKLENGSYVLYYTSGAHLFPEGEFYIGMATSADGVRWKKYNDPATMDGPFTDSDPVVTTGRTGEWDADIVLICDLDRQPDGFRLYYSSDSFGYASSEDGIHWEKYRGNPFYIHQDDPYCLKKGWDDLTLQGAKLLFQDSLCFMYYDYGHCENSAISMAIADR